MTTPSQPTEPPLPKLRQELQISPGRKNLNGEPTWLLYDPLRHRYIQIDETTFEVLSLWPHSRTGSELIAAINNKFKKALDPSTVAQFIEFAKVNALLTDTAAQGWRELSAQAERQKSGWSKRLLHNYLFFKVPLIQPERFLRATLPAVDLFYTRGFWTTTAAIGAVGLYFTSRQWDAFVGTFQNFFTFEGFMLFAITMFAVKALHELGHAYTAVRYGCRVPTIGVAFMMLTPLLYTDVTDAWRLRSRRQRLMIDSAGVIVELALACFAMFLWGFLPDGTLRGLAFVLATTSLIMSLVINLSPFMRFDGYYILSDLTGVENLQPRAFEIGRWQTRRILLGLKDPSPEPLPASKLWWLAVYAWATWIYRLALFIGIALVVYHYFFKILGLALFAFEIIYFVAKPVWKELQTWWERRSEFMATRRFVVSSALFSILLLVGFLPWSTRVQIPVIVEAPGLTHVYPPRAAEIAEIYVTPRQAVEKGQILIKLKSPELVREIALAETQLRTLELRLSRRTGDKEDRQQSIVLEGELVSLKTKIRGYKALLNELDIRAAQSGIILDLNGELHPNRAISTREPIATIGPGGKLIAKGYVGGIDLSRLTVGATGRLVPNDPTLPDVDITLSDIAYGGASQIEIPDLASTFGGPISVNQDASRRMLPTSAQYLVTAKLHDGLESPEQTIRGVLLVDGTAESLVMRALRNVARVLIRESGL